jgi:hypothetical protein
LKEAKIALYSLISPPLPFIKKLNQTKNFKISPPLPFPPKPPNQTDPGEKKNY